MYFTLILYYRQLPYWWKLKHLRDLACQIPPQMEAPKPLWALVSVLDHLKNEGIFLTEIFPRANCACCTFKDLR